MTKSKPDKEKLVREFELMREFEKWAGDFYRQIYRNPKAEDGELREAFKEIAGDEERHAEIIQKIINIVKNNL